jgi:hypothetical protein
VLDGTMTEPHSQSIRVVAFNGPFALLENTETFHMTQRTLTSYDLRSGTTVAGPSGGYSIYDGPSSTVHRALVSATGAIAVARDQAIVVARAGSGDQVLDDAPQVDPGSLALTGGTLSWRHGDETRTAELTRER